MYLCHTKQCNYSMVRAALIAGWGGEAVAIGGKGRSKTKRPRRPLHVDRGLRSHFPRRRT
jgi:hypothetical protein